MCPRIYLPCFLYPAPVVRSQVDMQGACLVAVAAVIANICESFLGATVQGRVSWLSNDVVNMLQISLAAGLAMASRLVLVQS